MVVATLVVSPAHAACDPDNPDAGGTVTCSDVDNDGFEDSDNNLTVNVQSGAQVNTNNDDAIDVQGTGNTVNNAGSITTTGAFGTGIITSIDSTVHNSGTIEAIDNAIQTGENSTIKNTGTIRSQEGAGINSSNGSRITNDGSINTVNGRGINGGNDVHITNNGRINATNDRGITADNRATVINKGSISAGGSNRGITAFNNSTVMNYGSVVSELSDGVYVNDDSMVINKGRIAGGEDALSLFARNTVYNSGTIENLNGPGGIAINVVGGSSDLTLVLLPGSKIIGRINLSPGTNILRVGNGLNVAKTFNRSIDVVDTNGAPFVALGNTVVVVDPTGFSQIDDNITDVTTGISGVLTGQMDAARANGATVVASGNGASAVVAPAGGVGKAYRAWAEVFGGVRDQGSDGATVGSTNVFGGIVAGVDTLTTVHGGRVGLFVGGSVSEVDVDFNNQDIDADSIFGGLYASFAANSIDIDTALTFGYVDYDSVRRVANNTVAGGIQKAKADFDGVFVSPEITFSTAMAVANSMRVKPSLTLRYTGLFLDGYTESGSAANLSVKSRDVHVLSARAQVAIPMTMAQDENGVLNTEIRVGVDGRTTVSGSNVNASLLGQSLNFDSGGDDEVLTGFAGAAFSYAMHNDVTLYGNVEAGYGTDDAFHATGRFGAKMLF